MNGKAIRTRAAVAVERLVTRTGYQIRKIPPAPAGQNPAPPRDVVLRDAVWPLPRASTLSDADIREAFAAYDRWHYAYEFDGGLSFSAHHLLPSALADSSERPRQRFRHFMPHLLSANGGSLEGLRVLDIACNAGFWSVQCALLGAEVTGFDARPELIEQANLIKKIVGLKNLDFKVLDFFSMNPEALGGTFDIVLNLGVMYHLPQPLDTLERTRAMATKYVLLDTGVHPTVDPAIYLRWEEPYDIHAAAAAGVVALPSRSSIDLLLRHIGASEWYEIPMRNRDMPEDYLNGRRASWLIKV
jgi:SAM-dependent methyltransferase